MIAPDTERVLILAPLGRDAAAAAQQLTDAGLACEICADLADMQQRLEEGAGAALIAEEAFREGPDRLNAWTQSQPAWSDFPFIVLTTQHTSPREHLYRLRLLQSLGNVSLLERPLSAVTLVSATQAALRARRRQYEVRSHLEEREAANERLERIVQQRTEQLVDTNLRLAAEIAEREEAESALQQAQKMEVIGQLTGGVAHDFNNLLTAILGNLELASRRVEDEKVARLLHGATEAARRGARLTTQLLAFSRKQRLQLEPVDINALVAGLSDLLLRTTGGLIQIETELGEGVWPVLIDASQVELIVLNLAVNARDAMPDGGRLTIRTANVRSDDPARPADLHEGDYVVLSVSDTGVGMTEDVQARAFEPFFTTKPVGSGTGLGLSQVYGITSQLGGRVSIESRVGKGTTVSLFLPRAEADASSAKPGEQQDKAVPVKRHGTVLLVDDDAGVRNVADECLRTLGYEVLAADGGQAAIRVLEGRAPIDLMLVDVAMPEVNGFEVARVARASRPDLPILFMSGYMSSPTEMVPQHPFLPKPFTLPELAAMIREALHGAPSPVASD